VTTQTTGRDPAVARLLCCHPVARPEPRCPALALARIPAHADSCAGGATTALARREPATGRSEAAA
jgi:hypothetical protein